MITNIHSNVGVVDWIMNIKYAAFLLYLTGTFQEAAATLDRYRGKGAGREFPGKFPSPTNRRKQVSGALNDSFDWTQCVPYAKVQVCTKCT